MEAALSLYEFLIKIGRRHKCMIVNPCRETIELFKDCNVNYINSSNYNNKVVHYDILVIDEFKKDEAMKIYKMFKFTYIFVRGEGFLFTKDHIRRACKLNDNVFMSYHLKTSRKDFNYNMSICKLEISDKLISREDANELNFRFSTDESKLFKYNPKTKRYILGYKTSIINFVKNTTFYKFVAFDDIILIEKNFDNKHKEYLFAECYGNIITNHSDLTIVARFKSSYLICKHKKTLKITNINKLPLDKQSDDEIHIRGKIYTYTMCPCVISLMTEEERVINIRLSLMINILDTLKCTLDY